MVEAYFHLNGFIQSNKARVLILHGQVFGPPPPSTMVVRAGRRLAGVAPDGTMQHQSKKRSHAGQTGTKDSNASLDRVPDAEHDKIICM